MILHTDRRTPYERQQRAERRRRMREAREDRRWKTLDEAGPSAYSAQLIERHLDPLAEDATTEHRLEAWQELAEALAGTLDEFVPDGASPEAAQLIERHLGPVPKDAPSSEWLDAFRKLAEGLAEALDDLDDREGDGRAEPRP